MSEQGELTPTILEEGRAEPESAPENGILKSESLDEEEKLELQVSELRGSVLSLPILGCIGGCVRNLVLKGRGDQ